ncbi:hypothetical protein ABTH17_19110, partial [Acinetobacter baumannii]
VAAGCALIRRDPSSGILYGFQGYADQTVRNQGFLKTSGYDITANYRFVPTDWNLPNWGNVSINMIGTYTDKLTVQPVPGSPTYDCA